MDQASGSRDEESEAEVPSAAVGPPPGESLRAAREARGESVEEIASALHLMPAQIHALEADDYAKFPAPIFISGYIRKYAVHLGLDPEALLVALHQARLETPPIRSELTARFPAPPRRGMSPGLLRIAAGVIAGVAVLAALWYLMRTPPLIDIPSGRPPPGMTAPDITSPETPPPETPPIAPQEATPAPGDAPAAPLAAAPASVPAPAPVPVLVAPPPEGPMDELVLTFSGGSWVEIIDVTGRRLAFRMGEEGDVLRLRGLAPFDILLGNAPNVAIDYNGSPYRDFPVSRQNVASFRLGRPGTDPGELPGIAPGEEP